ncbi:hypothetical protein J2Z47_001245 [Cohnella thailandensis]|nr:hypothetical protein [Cohnella thailandensis]
MTATKASVAFHTICVTSQTSSKVTTPQIKATMAPPQADQPMFKPLGCHMTKIKVTRNRTEARANIIPLN